jgi:hypothetical protein
VHRDRGGRRRTDRRPHGGGDDRPRRKRRRTPSYSSDDSSSSRERTRRRRRTRRKKRRSRSSSDRSSKLHSSKSDSDSDNWRDLSPASRRAREKQRKARRDKRHFENINQMWNIDFRPPFLQTIKGCADHTIEAVMGFKVQYDKEAERRNLGEDIFQRDGVTRKTRFKAQSDNGTTKLHLARYLWLPLLHPKDYYKHMPSRRDVVVRNFPMDHYGLTGQIKDDVIRKVHNRSPLEPQN